MPLADHASDSPAPFTADRARALRRDLLARRLTVADGSNEAKALDRTIGLAADVRALLDRASRAGPADAAVRWLVGDRPDDLLEGCLARLERLLAGLVVENGPRPLAEAVPILGRIAGLSDALRAAGVGRDRLLAAGEIEAHLLVLLAGDLATRFPGLYPPAEPAPLPEVPASPPAAPAPGDGSAEAPGTGSGRRVPSASTRAKGR